MLKYVFFLLTTIFMGILGLQAQPLKIVLDYYPNPNHMLLYVAHTKGFFKEQNLDIEIIVPTDFQLGSKLVATQKADIGITYGYYLCLYINKGLPISRLGGLIKTPMNSLMVLEKSGIRTIQDLKGKTVGIHGMGTGKTFLEHIFKQSGLMPGDVKFALIKNQGTQLLLADKVQGLSGAHPIMDKDLIQKHNETPRFFRYADYGVPVYEDVAMFTHKDHKNAPWVKPFIKALEQAYAAIHKDPSLAYQSVKSVVPNLLYKDSQFRAMIPHLQKHPQVCNRADYEKLLAFFKSYNVVSTHISVNQVLGE
jgi:putative hydroxymethylpyrimidine transport system substrate-binding protein